jgi:predicted permease
MRPEHWLYTIPLRLRSLFRRSQTDQELDDELRDHIERKIEQYVAKGLPPEEARRQALLEMGGMEKRKEECRDARHVNWIQDLAQDLRFGVRMLRKSPGFTAVAVLTLALGIGANTTIFSFINALLFRLPAVEAPQQLLEFWNTSAKIDRYSFIPLNYPDYRYFRDHNQAFSGLAAFDDSPLPVTWNRSGVGEIVQGQLVSANFFSVLGVQSVLGRTFSPEESQTAGENPVVVLSHAFWQQRLNADPRVLGETLLLNGTAFAIVGVAPSKFTGARWGSAVDFWTPLSMAPSLKHDPSLLTDRDNEWLFGIGRLQRGVSASQAKANLALLSHQLQQQYPESNKGIEAVAYPFELVPGPSRRQIGALGGGLMVIVGLVLLIACVNVANMLLAKAATARREMAVRAALGAGRMRLMRQTLTQSILLALLGGVGAIPLALGTIPFLLALQPPDLPLNLQISLDWRVFIFTFAVAFVTGVVFGSAPALRSARVDVMPALRDETYGGRSRRSRLGSILVLVQVAVCLLLLIGAGLCIRSLLNVGSIDFGFDTNHEVIAQVDLGGAGYSDGKGAVFYQQLLQRLAALPGVTSVGRGDRLPLAMGETVLDVKVEGRSARSAIQDFTTHIIDAGPGYFAALGTPVMQGREFTARDGPGAPRVVVINEAAAKRFWPGQNPIGRHLIVAYPATQISEVVGVVKTVKVRDLTESPVPVVYRSILQFYSENSTLVVHAAGDPRFLLHAIPDEVQALDGSLVVTDLETMQQYMEEPLFPSNTAASLLGAFGLLALALSATGLYGVMSYTVSQRTHEIGIRLALGAKPRDVLRLVVGQGMSLVLIGVIIGLAGALALTQLLSSLLYGIKPTDPTTFVAVAIVLVIVALAACYIPARRAMRVDPMVALRHE